MSAQEAEQAGLFVRAGGGLNLGGEHTGVADRFTQGLEHGPGLVFLCFAEHRRPALDAGPAP